MIVLYDALSEQERFALRGAGAEEFIARPFGRDELAVRLQNMLRRRDSARFGSHPNVGNELVCGELKMEIAERRVTRGGREIRLTPLEFNLLRAFMLHVGKVLTQRYLLKTVWGPQAGADSTHLRVFVAALRAKIEVPSQRYLRTERKVGYTFAAPDAHARKPPQ